MADIQNTVFNITNLSYAEKAETVVFDLSQQQFSGKITSITINLENHSICTNTGFVFACTELYLHSGNNMLDEQVDKIAYRYVENQKIEYNPITKIIPGSKLAHGGNCSFSLVIKANGKIHGDLNGTITVYYTQDAEEQNKTTILGLNQNAVTDWFKTLSVEKTKSGKKDSSQFQINKTISKTQMLLWDNREIKTKVSDKVGISLHLSVTNSTNTVRTIQLTFKAAYGSEEYVDDIGSGTWSIGAGETREIDTADTYEKAVLPNDGVALLTINATTLSGVTGNITGAVIVETTSVGSGESGDSLTDQDINSVKLDIFGQSYTISGNTSESGSNTDSFMSAYSGQGYNSDMNNASSDAYKTMGLADDIAIHVEQLEQRLTALENRMTDLALGGAEDWYDGGSDGTNNNWGTGEWYKQSEQRTTVQDVEQTISYDLIRSSSNMSYRVFSEGERGYVSQKYGNCIIFTFTVYDIPEMLNKVYQSAGYDLFFSFNAKSEDVKAICENWISRFGVFSILLDVGAAPQSEDVEMKFNSISYVSKNFKGTLNDFKDEPVEEDCRISVYCDLLFHYETEEQKNTIISKVLEDIERLKQLYDTGGVVFAKVSGTLKYSVKDKTN